MNNDKVNNVISIIKNIINDRKELNNSSFDSPIIIEK